MENLENKKTIIKIDHVRKVYTPENRPEVVALKDVELEIKENEFICVVGPSGCGKTTLLNIIAGLEKPTSGKAYVEGREIQGPGPDRGVIFQQYALFPWLTVKKNILYGTKFLRHLEPVFKKNKETGEMEPVYETTTKVDENGKKVTEVVYETDKDGNKVPKQAYKLVKYSKAEREAITNKYMHMVRLDQFANSYPKELSGGMKQRVAIARGYALNSDVLLLDEPFGALDAQTRSQLQEDLLKTWETEKKTCFFITHDVDEAVLLSTRVIIMSARPGVVKEIINIDLPFPRSQATKLEPKFIEYRNHIWEVVYKMYLDQGDH